MSASGRGSYTVIGGRTMAGGDHGAVTPARALYSVVDLAEAITLQMSQHNWPDEHDAHGLCLDARIANARRYGCITDDATPKTLHVTQDAAFSLFKITLRTVLHFTGWTNPNEIAALSRPGAAGSNGEQALASAITSALKSVTNTASGTGFDLNPLDDEAINSLRTKADAKTILEYVQLIIQARSVIAEERGDRPLPGDAFEYVDLTADVPVATTDTVEADSVAPSAAPTVPVELGTRLLKSAARDSVIACLLIAPQGNAEIKPVELVRDLITWHTEKVAKTKPSKDNSSAKLAAAYRGVIATGRPITDKHQADFDEIFTDEIELQAKTDKSGKGFNAVITGTGTVAFTMRCTDDGKSIVFIPRIHEVKQSRILNPVTAGTYKPEEKANELMREMIAQTAQKVRQQESKFEHRKIDCVLLHQSSGRELTDRSKIRANLGALANMALDALVMKLVPEFNASTVSVIDEFLRKHPASLTNEERVTYFLLTMIRDIQRIAANETKPWDARVTEIYNKLHTEITNGGVDPSLLPYLAKEKAALANWQVVVQQYKVKTAPHPPAT